MNETGLLKELALRAGVHEPEARGVLLALRDLLREGRIREDVLWSCGCAPMAGSSDAVDELIACARRHPLGVDFLVGGYLPSVAAEFHTHAFTVEAARQRLREEPAR